MDGGVKVENYKFFQNTKCEYFPCHAGADKDSFNCLFCYCPLYALGDQCGGSFTYTEGGIKDCSKCLKPHRAENYDRMMQSMLQVMELAKKKP